MDMWPWVKIQIVSPVNIPIPTKKTKMGCTYPKMVPWVLTHSHVPPSLRLDMSRRPTQNQPSDRSQSAAAGRRGRSCAAGQAAVGLTSESPGQLRQIKIGSTCCLWSRRLTSCFKRSRGQSVVLETWDQSVEVSLLLFTSAGPFGEMRDRY